MENAILGSRMAFRDWKPMIRMKMRDPHDGTSKEFPYNEIIRSRLSFLRIIRIMRIMRISEDWR
jgi:hypothetical protein